jgi:exonuclease SbcC
MKIKKVEIEAFRAYKLKSEGTFDFTQANGDPSDFVAIYAPNGFGKSSFYDAVEWAVTNHLERLGGEYNKVNFEGAAKITKDENVGQKILRNKYVSDNVPTEVVVSTTRLEPFSRRLPNIRTNGRDLKFGDHKKKENEFFRRVILSQDEIDRFLREAKPQDRYIKFMESFGGDLEIARKELSALISDNKADLSALDQRRDSIIDELDQPLDTSVFDHFNGVAEELNTAGENIILADEDFSSQAEHALSSSLVARQHELNVAYDANVRTMETLVGRLAKLPEIALHSSILVAQESNSERLTKGVSDGEKYQSFLDSHAKCEADLQQTSARLEDVGRVAEYTDYYLGAVSRLQEISARQTEAREEYSAASTQLLGVEKEFLGVKQELQLADERALILRNSIENSGPVYSELSTRRARAAVIEQQISDKEISIRLDESKFSELGREFEKLSNQRISPESLLSGDIQLKLLNQERHHLLVGCFNELELLQRHDLTIHATQEALAEQMGLHERIVASGLEYLSAWPSKICPLCSTPHESEVVLLDKVKGQSLLSQLSHDNAEKLATSRARQTELKDEIQAITREALTAHAEQNAILRVKLKESDERLTKARAEMSALESELKATTGRIRELEQSVWSLSNDDLLNRVGAELIQLTGQRSSLTTRQTELVEKIEKLKNAIVDSDSEYKALVSEAISKTDADSFVLVHRYLSVNGLTPADLREHCALRKTVLEAEVAGFKLTTETLLAKAYALHQEMLAEGNWISFSLLKEQKETLDLSLAQAQASQTAFYDSLFDLVVAAPQDDLNAVEALISEKLQQCRQQAQELEKKVNRFKLLTELLASFKPYIERISLEEELTRIERDLDQRNRVDTTLVEERDAIVAELKALIDDFFYEGLINAIYRKIDPHPSFKKVEFKADFDSDKPGLNIVVSDETGASISPILYFSAAQSNILSLSVFLASALHAKDDNGDPVDVIMIDDPIQSMDSINILSTIDLLRSICLQFNKQVIISTHDENFFGLLQRKIPAEIIGSKFLQLERFGVAVPVEPFVN